MAFTLFGGRACFGPAGTLRRGVESPWLDAALLAASTQRGDGEGWVLVEPPDRDAPFEAGYGTRTAGSAHESSDLADLLDDVELKTLKIIAPGSTDRAAAPTLAALIGTQGLRDTVADLAARVDEADDALNLGYLRVQTDLYRLRQSVLKQSQATRFAVSPALTQIADLDNASATREQLADFYQDVRADKTILKRDSGNATTLAAMNLREAPAPRDVVMGRLQGASIFSNVSTTTTSATRPQVAALATAVEPQAFIGPSVGLRFERADVSGLLADVGKRAPPSASTVTGADALTGKAEIRTTSIAARMERPRSIEAKDFSVATRADIIAKLAALGLDMDGLEVHGLVSKDAAGAVQFDTVTGQPRRGVKSTLKALRESNFAAVLSDADPKDDKADESAFFFSGVDLSDYSVALLRSAEGIVRRYRDALERMRKALDSTQGLLQQVRCAPERGGARAGRIAPGRGHRARAAGRGRAARARAEREARRADRRACEVPRLFAGAGGRTQRGRALALARLGAGARRRAGLPGRPRRAARGRAGHARPAAPRAAGLVSGIAHAPAADRPAAAWPTA